MADVQAKIVHDTPRPKHDSRRLRESVVITSRQTEKLHKDLVNLVNDLADRVEQLEARQCRCKV